MFVLAVVSLGCVLGVLHTYLFYPTYVRYLARRVRRPLREGSMQDKEWPAVRILMAVHNEEVVLPAKLDCLIEQDYPGTLHIYIANDCSTDRTAAILASAVASAPPHRPIYVTHNPYRRGKPSSINTIARGAGPQDVNILTDASVMMPPTTVRALLQPLMQDASIGLVDSTLVHTDAGVEGIARSELQYINGEVALKRAEGRAFGYTMGPFGGCFALRAAAFTSVPDTFLVDDFFLCMSAYRRGWRGVSSPEAVVYESVGQTVAGEFRRKVRISSGNWQNLVHFSELWWPPHRSALAFAFFSHKVLRWLTPFLLLLLAVCLLLLWRVGGNYWAGLTLVLGGSLPVLTWLVDTLLRQVGIALPHLRHLNYFLAMNAALLVGFVRYLTGITTNVWQPSHRPRRD